MGAGLAITFSVRAGVSLRRLTTRRPPRPALGDAPTSRPAPRLAPPTTPRQVPPPRGVTHSCPGKGGGDRNGGGGGGSAAAQDSVPPAFPPRPHPNVRADVTTAPSRTEAGFFSAPFFLRRKRLAGGERKRRDKLPRVQCRHWNWEMRRRGCRCVGFYPSLVSHYGFFCGFDHAVTFGCSPAGIG